MPLASVSGVIEGHAGWALALLFLLVALESLGLPLPGETALIACAALASDGALSIVAVIVIAAAAAIVGDNLGYLVARKGGRRVLRHFAVTRRYADRYLPRSERFFAVHGGSAVFAARFVAFLRVTIAWTAGLSEMRWRHFLAWNAGGGIAWATAVGLLAYYLGAAAAGRLGTLGLLAAGCALVLGGLGYLAARRRSRPSEKVRS